MYNMKHNYRKETIKSILDDRPEGYQVANKYKVLVGMLRRRYKSLATVEYGTLVDIVFDAVQGNREWQQLSEGHDEENKRILEQKWKIEQGYHSLPPHVINTHQRNV